MLLRMWRALGVLLVPMVLAATGFEFPEHKIEILPKGFKVSVADAPGATLFAVHINVNEEMDGLDAGHFAKDIVKKKNGRWTFHEKNRVLKDGDILYYWLYLIVDGLGYRLDNQEFRVSGTGGGQPVPTPAPESTTSSTLDTKAPDCVQSRTRMGGKTICSGQTIFYDDFSSGLDNWSNEVRFSDAPESDFTVWTKEFGTNGLSSGNLYILPKLLEEVTNQSFVSEGTMFLNGCTTRAKKYCNRAAMSWSILPPIVSSRLTTKFHFSFLYGEVEFRAKLPEGDWIVPELWLEPKEVYYGEKSGRIYLGKAVGNPTLKDSQNVEIGASRLQQGYYVDSWKTVDFKLFNNKAWTSHYHVYSIRWTPESIKFFVDGHEMGSVTPTEETPLNPNVYGGSLLAPFDREFYLSLGLHVGGRLDFPDGCVSNGFSKPWRNTAVKHTLDFWRRKDDWYPTWRTPSNQLQIDYVKVTALSSQDAEFSLIPEDFWKVPKSLDSNENV